MGSSNEEEDGQKEGSRNECTSSIEHDAGFAGFVPSNRLSSMGSLVGWMDECPVGFVGRGGHAEDGGKMPRVGDEGAGKDYNVIIEKSRCRDLKQLDGSLEEEEKEEEGNEKGR